MIIQYFWFCFTSFLLLGIYQIYHYEIKPLVKYIFKNFVFIYTPICIFVLGEYLNKYLIYLSLPFILLFGLILIRKVKVHLKFTGRVKRLVFTYFVLFFLFSLLVSIAYGLVLIPIFLVISNYLNKPVESLINHHYIQKARKKLVGLKAVKIGITGSYGKTSTKNYLYDLMKNDFVVMKTPKSFNTPLGVAKFINGNDFTFKDFVILEFGARRVNDIKKLKKYYPIDIAIVTGITAMHIDTFKTLENIIEEKMSLVDNCGISILNYENEYIRNHPKQSTFTYGFEHGMYRAKNIKLSVFGTIFDLYIKEKYIKTFSIKPIGRGAVLNCLPLFIICDLYNISYENLVNIEMVENRLSVRVMEDYYILDDAYNSNIIGASYALEVVKEHIGKRFMITPGFFEMDKIEDELCDVYSKKINESLDCVILVENSFTKKLSKFLDIEYKFVNSFKEGFLLFLKIKEDKSILLIENDLLE